MRYFRVVSWNSFDDLEVLSISFSDHEDAIRFKNSEHIKLKYPDAFIVELLFGDRK